MKRAISIFLVILSVFITCAHGAYADMRDRTRHAANPDAYQEYLYDLQVYYTDRQAYERARDQYKAYQTAQSKEDALDATKEMLESSRIAMLQYIELASNYLQEQEPVNDKVQNAIISDMNLHKEFLATAAQTISDIESLDQAKVTGDALDLRYKYIKVTAAQALSYIDAVAAKKRNDEARALVNKIQTIVAGFPEENRSRIIVQKWIEDINPEIAFNEGQLIQYIEDIYPGSYRDTPRPYFEQRSGPTSTVLYQIVIKQKEYASKFREMEGIAKDAYTSL
jgi:hypothetical protein